MRSLRPKRPSLADLAFMHFGPLNRFPSPHAGRGWGWGHKKSGERRLNVALAQNCLDAKGVGCEAWEQEINERVAALYGL